VNCSRAASWPRQDARDRLRDRRVSIPYEGADPEAAMAWLSERLDSEACLQVATDPPDCKKVFGAARVSLRIGAETSPSIRIDLTGLDVSPTPGPGETG
jgi:hypothetical protein